MSATTAIQSVATPATAKTTQASLMAMARATFARMVASVDAAEADGERHCAQIVGHERDVGGLDGGVGAGGAHRDADIRRGERRRVVDAVADHRHRTELVAHPLDEIDLVGRHQRRTHRRRPGRLRPPRARCSA